ncbi:unnamed protein product [Phytomonas sp. EM1]|nr:unnamed protein product [Phytomonas sp. EM1]|eukprot:CCW61291.1 unnamed protein product [Phytomonas sp. isolate EM1]
MEGYKTSADNTPLLVNFLRLIRNGRQEQCDIILFNAGSLVSFHFGGLRMFDLGAFTEAEDLWSTLAKEASSEGPWDTEGLTFAGPLYLVVTYNDVVIEQWELVDYRDANFENSIPSSCEQLEELNMLVRIIYTYLRVSNIRRYVSQCLLQSDANGTFGCDSSLQSMQGSGADTENAAEETSNVKRFLITIHGKKEEIPKLDVECTRPQRWCIADLIRITVTTNALARTQLLTQTKQSNQPPTTSARLDSTGTHPSPRKGDSMTRGKVFECTLATPGGGARIVSPTTNAAPAIRDRATPSPSGSLKSQCTPSLAPTAALIPTCGMLSPSLLPRLPSTRMTPLSLAQGGCGAFSSLAIKSSTPREMPDAGIPLLTTSFSRLPRADAPDKGVGCDASAQMELNDIAPPDFVRRMATTLFDAKNVKVQQQQRLPRSVGIVLDTMAALPLHPDAEDYNNDDDSISDGGTENIGTGGSSFDLLELAQRIHTSLAAARQTPLRDLLLPLNLE